MAKISQPFLRFELSFKSNFGIELAVKNLIFFLPLLPLKHGEFIPVTAKEYNQESQQHMNTLE